MHLEFRMVHMQYSENTTIQWLRLLIFWSVSLVQATPHSVFEVHHYHHHQQQHSQQWDDTDAADQARHLLVSYTSDTSKQALLEVVGVQVQHDFDDQIIALWVEETAYETVLAFLEDDPHIGKVQVDSVWTEQGEFNQIVDRQLAETTPYGIEMVQANLVSMGPHPVKVCLVDTGVADGHPDLDFSLIHGVGRTSLITGHIMSWNQDRRGHGTHIAGTVSAIAQNNIGVRGMGDIELFITRGLNNDGKARESDIREAILQCHAAGAKIVSLSLAGTRISTAMNDTINRLYHEEGCLILAAAGNNATNEATFPAANPNVVSVSAVTQDGTRWEKANYGSWIELSAPGDKIVSTGLVNTGDFGYTSFSGTSMAAPHVAGAAAILWSHFPECTHTQIRYALAYTATGQQKECSNGMGYGVIQVKDALEFLNEHHCVGAIWGQADPTSNCDSIDVEPIQSSWYKSWSYHSN